VSPHAAGHLRHAPPTRRLAQAAAAIVFLFALLPLPALAQVQATGEYLQRMDLDGDGRVSLEEYLAWMNYAFERMDRNGDGVLSADELPGGRGQPLTRAAHRARLADRFNRQDANRDGFLDVRELAAPPL
jgi:Ca2+-binding EF-hand superfamily protein